MMPSRGETAGGGGGWGGGVDSRGPKKHSRRGVNTASGRLTVSSGSLIL